MQSSDPHILIHFIPLYTPAAWRMQRGNETTIRQRAIREREMQLTIIINLLILLSMNWLRVVSLIVDCVGSIRTSTGELCFVNTVLFCYQSFICACVWSENSVCVTQFSQWLYVHTVLSNVSHCINSQTDPEPGGKSNCWLCRFISNIDRRTLFRKHGFPLLSVVHLYLCLIGELCLWNAIFPVTVYTHCII